MYGMSFAIHRAVLLAVTVERKIIQNVVNTVMEHIQSFQGREQPSHLQIIQKRPKSFKNLNRRITDLKNCIEG